MVALTYMILGNTNNVRHYSVKNIFVHFVGPATSKKIMQWHKQ